VRKSHSTWSRPATTTRWARPKRSQQEGWYNDDNDDEDQPFDTKFVGGSREEMDLRDLPREDENGSAQIGRYSYDDADEDDDDIYDDDVYEEDEAEFEDEPEEDVGNFWSNPLKGFDPIPDPQTRPSPRRRTRRDGADEPTSTATPHRRESRRRSSKKPSKTTFRSGTPSPPKAMEDLYNRIFWYGFDPSETTSPADRTVFGGTKGKFNGLAYLNDESGVKPSDKRSRRIRPRNRDADESDREGRNRDADERDRESDREERNRDFDDKGYRESDREERDRDFDDERDRERNRQNMDYDDDGDYYETDSSPYQEEPTDEEERPTTQYRQQQVTPPYDPPRPMPRAPTSVPVSPRREKRRAPKNRDYEDDDDDDWISGTVSSWFGSNEQEEEDDEEEKSPRRGRKKRRPDSSSSSPFKILDVFFGLNRGQLDEKAKMYDSQMGRRKDEDWSRAAKEKPRRQRRKGYAYPYVDDEDEALPVADYGVNGDEEPFPDSASEEASPKEGRKEVEEKEPAPKRQLTWEERALAVERVPPAGIQAWGPTGDLGMDVRTKAISDALEDIIGERREVTEKESEVEQAREDIAILKVDAELERKRLRRSRQDPRVIQDKLRKIDRKVDDAGRALRYAQNVLQEIRDNLAELEARHWAVLSFYSPDLAEESVSDAIREFEQNEPAARRFREKVTSAAAASETVADLGKDVGSSSDTQTQP
jgi:hypothetical protein